MSTVNVKDLPDLYVKRFMPTNVETDKRGRILIGKGALKKLSISIPVIAQVEIYELISSQYKLSGDTDIDDIIEYLSGELVYIPMAYSQTIKKIQQEELKRLVKNFYIHGATIAGKFLMKSVLDCEDMEEVVGEAAIKLMDLWNTTFMRLDPHHGRVGLDALL